MAPFAIWVMAQHKDGAGRFATALRRFQRRLRMSLFVRSLPPACSCALAAVDVGCLVLRPAAAFAILACTGVLLLTILAAWLVALVRTPSLSTTAGVLDRRARWDDRAVTALQFAAAGDAVARLIVGETTTRLERTPVSVLPLDVSRPWRWGAVAVLGVTGLIVVGLHRLNTGSLSLRASASSVAAPSAQAGRANTRQGSSNAAHTSDEQTAAGPAHPDTRMTAAQKVNGGDATRALGDTRPTAGSTAMPPTGAAQGMSQSDRVGSASVGRTDGAAPARGAPDGDLAGGGDASRTGTVAASVAGRGARGATRSAVAGGGVAGGALARDGAAPTTSRSASRVLSSADARRAYARAEAATVRERVPPRLRSYVRDYFLAIRPQPTP